MAKIVRLKSRKVCSKTFIPVLTIKFWGHDRSWIVKTFLEEGINTKENLRVLQAANLNDDTVVLEWLTHEGSLRDPWQRALKDLLQR